MGSEDQTSTSTSTTANMQKQPFVIGVAGGAASGKNIVCDMIIQQLHDQRVVFGNQDSFYHNMSEEELKRVHEYNLDHPGEVNPYDVIILEGVLVFHDPRVPEVMNMKIFVDTDDDVRLARRIRRDTMRRGEILERFLISGESMENALHACCKGIKIGKILIHREGDNGQQMIYEKLPQDIAEHVLLLDLILGTGNSAVQPISLLIKKGLPKQNIMFLNLRSPFQAPQG